MVRFYVIGLMVILSFGQLHTQVPKDSKQVLGKWSFTLVEIDNRPTFGRQVQKVWFRFDGDSLVRYTLDEYGNYEPHWKLPKTPSKSGPNGLYYEWTENELRDNRDTLYTVYWVKFTNLNRPIVRMTYGFKWIDRGEEVSSYSETWTGQRVK